MPVNKERVMLLVEDLESGLHRQRDGAADHNDNGRTFPEIAAGFRLLAEEGT